MPSQKMFLEANKIQKEKKKGMFDKIIKFLNEKNWCGNVRMLLLKAINKI